MRIEEATPKLCVCAPVLFIRGLVVCILTYLFLLHHGATCLVFTYCP